MWSEGHSHASYGGGAVQGVPVKYWPLFFEQRQQDFLHEPTGPGNKTGAMLGLRTLRFPGISSRSVGVFNFPT